MERAYVGTANRHGLELFLPDNRETVAAVARSAWEGVQPRACFFAAVSDELVSVIRSHLRAGRPVEAILALEANATEIAPLLPTYELFDLQQAEFDDT